MAHYLLFFSAACCLLLLFYLFGIIEEEKLFLCVPNLRPLVRIDLESENAAGGHVVNMNNAKVVCKLGDTVVVREYSHGTDLVIQSPEYFKKFTGRRQVQLPRLDDLILTDTKMLGKYLCCS